MYFGVHKFAEELTSNQTASKKSKNPVLDNFDSKQNIY